MNFKTYLTKNINFIEHDLEVFASGRTSDGLKYLRLLLSDMEYDLAELEKDEKAKAEILEKLRNKSEEIEITTFDDSKRKFLMKDGTVEERDR